MAAKKTIDNRTIPVSKEHHEIHNADVADNFDQIANLLDFKRENPFRIRAYRNAARTVRDLPEDLGEMILDGADLQQLPCIGKDLAAQITEMETSGHSRMLESLKDEMPAGISTLIKIPGLGPAKARILFTELGIETPRQLAEAARNKKISSLKGFGPKTEERLLHLVEANLKAAVRYRYSAAAQYAEPLLQFLKTVPGVVKAEIAGSYRRKQDTVGDLDILVAAGHDCRVTESFVSYGEVREILSKGAQSATVILKCGLQVDLRVCEEETFGSALVHFTGSKNHNIKLRQRAQRTGLKINEYGVWRGAERIAGQTESSIYRAVGLPTIPPELREAHGEIEAAEAGKLPDLIRIGQLKGDLHVHTRASDGHNSIEEMAYAAAKAGLEYIAITDHSQSTIIAHGLSPERALKHLAEIDEVRAKIKDIAILKGMEVDILPDGKLDLPDSVLQQLDIVVCAIHSHFNLSYDEQTARILKAMDNPYFQILGHPSGRLLTSREAYKVDMAKIIDKAASKGHILELNAQPQRLDLDDMHCRMAKEAGILLSINSDAHSVHQFAFLAYGINQARRGWLEAGDVINTRPLKQMLKILKRDR